MRDEIVKYLGTVAHSTAKTIADRIGVDRLEVSKELNHMYTEAIVERGKQPGAGNEYLYWLSRNDDVAKLEAAIGAPNLPAMRDETPPVAATKPEALGADVEAELAALRAEVFDLKASNSNRQNKIRDLEARCATQTATIRDREADHDAIRLRLGSEKDSLIAEIKLLCEANDALEATVQMLRDQVGQQTPAMGASVANALRPFVGDGQKIIWREPFRWHDDRGVMSNHFEGMTLEALAETFGYEIIINCELAAIIKPRHQQEKHDASDALGSAETA